MTETPRNLREVLYEQSGGHLAKLVGEMVEVLRNRVDKTDTCMLGYQEFLRHYHDPGSQGAHFVARMATFHPNYFREKTDITPVGDFQITDREDCGECNILYATLEQLEAAQAEQGLPDVSYIMIPELGAVQCKDQSAKLFEQLRWTYPDCEMEYQLYQRGEDSPPTATMSTQEFLDLAERWSTSPESCRPYANGRPPLNFLNISGKRLSLSFAQSRAVQVLGLTLLHHLSTRVCRKKDSTCSIGKQMVQSSALVDGESCIQFQLLGLPGTISMWHMDVMGMTWVQTLFGIKVWCVVDRPDDEALWAAFKDSETSGMSWRPPQGTVKMIPITPGHTLLMMPGKFTAHLPVSTGDSYTHMIGGQVWPKDPAYLERLLNSLMYLLENNDTVTNECAPRELPDLLDELREEIFAYMKQGHSPLARTGLPSYELEHLQKLDSFISTAEPLLSCKCEDALCETKTITIAQGNAKRKKVLKCPCHQSSSQVSHNGGCTAWCHGGKHLSSATRDCLPRLQSRKRKK